MYRALPLLTRLGSYFLLVFAPVHFVVFVSVYSGRSLPLPAEVVERIMSLAPFALAFDVAYAAVLLALLIGLVALSLTAARKK
jgi:hypothetical protein